MKQWRASAGIRWLGWTALFSLALAGALVVFTASAQAYPAVFWVLIAGLVALAFFIGVRLRTGWWTLGPVLAYGVPATIYMIAANAQYQAMPHKGLEGLTWDWFVVITGAALVAVPCGLSALAGATWATRSQSLAADGRRVRRPRTPWSGLMTPRSGPTAREVLLARSAAMTAPRSHPSPDQGTDPAEEASSG